MPVSIFWATGNFNRSLNPSLIKIVKGWRGMFKYDMILLTQYLSATTLNMDVLWILVKVMQLPFTSLPTCEADMLDSKLPGPR